jgi:plasmid maintenance system antidote protein VapI
VTTSARTPDAGDLRAALARRRPRLPHYQLAARVRVDPGTLSRLLNERAPLSAEVARRIDAAIREGEESQ